MHKKVLWRLLIWLVLVGYIALDFLVFKGPLHRSLTSGNEPEPDVARGIAARVFHKPIYLSQLDYAVDKLLWQRGRTRADVGDGERTYLRQLVIRDMADQYILRTKLKDQMKEYPVSDEEITAAVKRFSARFKNKNEMIETLKNNGIQGDKELRYRFAARIQQEQYIQKFTEPDEESMAAEALKIYEEHQQEFAVPERVRVRHVFRARLENTKAEALQILEEAKAAVLASNDQDQTFVELVKLHSEDAGTNQQGGDLGWIMQGRIAEDFTQAVFSAELNTFSIIETKLGWHLTQVVGQEGQRLRSYDEVKEELMLALRNFRRRNNVEKFRIALRKQQADKIKIDWKMLEKPWTVAEAKIVSTGAEKSALKGQ